MIPENAPILSMKVLTLWSVFHDFVEEVKLYDCIIIYSNPTQIEYLKENQFSSIYNFSGWHPRLNTNLLSNHHY